VGIPTRICREIGLRAVSKAYANNITRIIRCWHIRSTDRPTAWQIPRTHEQTLKDYRSRRTCWASNNNSVKTRALRAILITRRDFFVFFFLFSFFRVTQSFVGFRWTELNSITRPGMSEFDARLTTKRPPSYAPKGLHNARTRFSRSQRVARNSPARDFITRRFSSVIRFRSSAETYLDFIRITDLRAVDFYVSKRVYTTRAALELEQKQFRSEWVKQMRVREEFECLNDSSGGYGVLGVPSRRIKRGTLKKS